uniref:Uncharacterized protein n=1 Tax=Octactis speculum TaxID=3111310 RepID=A0A7S2F515_9STRA
MTPCLDNDVWSAPPGFVFNVSADAESTIRAAAGPPAARPPLHVVHMRQPGCMKRAVSVAEAFRDNHPRCRSCLNGARPSLRMKGVTDLAWSDVEANLNQYAAWKKDYHDRLALDPNRTLVILEIGTRHRCGDGKCTGGGLLWTSERTESESVYLSLTNQSAGSQATLIRINPDFPLLDHLQPTDACLKNYVGIMEDELVALERIDALLMPNARRNQ